MNHQVLFSSMSDNWNTPLSLYEMLNEEFHFDYDPCPSNPSSDGLLSEWRQCNFVNPPFSEWQKWVEKGVVEWRKGKTVVFLIAARTDTKAFHNFILPFAREIRFIRGRLKFGEGKKSAPFASMIVIYDHEVRNE